ncbi:MAG: undecaprenyl-phosphate glucose phosphotransferase [Chitinophagaceae bacterium]|nr:undecaprenyl-phosphate glucose phosphotransferase [Chitinophagaceae bacterium]
MNQQFERYLKGTLILLDLLVLNLSNFILQPVFGQDFTHEYIRAYNRYFLITNILWILVTFILALYNRKAIVYFTTFIKRTARVFLLYLMLLLAFLFFSRELIVSRWFIFYSTSSFALALALIRFIYLGFIGYFRNSEALTKRVLILGYNNTAAKLADYLESEEQNIQLVGFSENEENIHELTNYPILCDISSTLEVAKKMQVHEIYSTIMPEQDRDLYEMMNQAEKQFIKFKVVPDLNSFFAYDSHIEFYGSIPVLSRRNSALDDMGNIIKKRVLDLVVSSLVIIFLLSWMIPLIGIMIAVESGFPVFFRQLRTGMTDKRFWCLKFRSMKVNKDCDKQQATPNDARITRVGKFLRKTSLDEFPQFINVFMGDISLVGPRPHMLKHTSDYSKVVEEFSVRQFVKPGITGWAQINGFRGEIKGPEDIRKRVEKDLWYIENWTLWLDIQIIFLTVYKVFKGDKNAY